ncbi:tRNA uridine(34) 5-carboxymethylaminomethyl modification radical SAM/GNAT enzyme Elp3 [Candidatus Parcubacteria bacterium]|nr:MAG: tRNA uridine(34) 5-carboxymethylaminomethyl modification radical SAM/GNAT enzyme Elp3 [Candidatus Parcubacteria bacterium]
MKSNFEKIIKHLIKVDPEDRSAFVIARRKMSNSLKIAPPQSSDLIRTYRQLLKKKKIKENKTVLNFLKKREVRTISGVAPIAVLTKPYPCPGKCIYCPTESKMPKSYLSSEPAVMRAIINNFDPFKQVRMRLRALGANGHELDKCELIILGGTWSFLPKPYQQNFIRRCFDGLNGKISKNLASAQKLNETAKNRCVGITVETRPDYIDAEEIARMRNLGVTKVEIGLQNISDDILKLNKRGHNVNDVIEATKMLKDAGFKVGYHLMPNLLGATVKSDLEMFKKIFNDNNFKPDYLKIYPCVVTKNSRLYKLWRQKKYKSYTDKQLCNLLLQIKKIMPPYVRISRLVRDIPSENIVAGNKISNLRQLLSDDLKKKKITCRCIRCRETGHNLADSASLIANGSKPKLKIKKYPASDGTEYFLSYESSNRKILYAFLRLRLPKKTDAEIIKAIPEIDNSALIRELHTYGQLIPLRKTGQVQHTGFGKKLMAEAEKICRQSKLKKIAVISGIGVRQYYKKLGYRLEDSYMTKTLKKRPTNNSQPAFS